MISSGCALHITVKYDQDEDQMGTVASPKIVLEVIENDQEKRRLDVGDYYSPVHSGFF